nr:hypothetical protein [Tanacetum cinerariifolium]
KMVEENILAPTRSDDQLVPVKARLPYGKSNLLLDLQNLQKNLIFYISIDILQNTNFFRAFTTLANALSIYIQYPSFCVPPAGEQVMDFVNELGYPECLTGKTFESDKPRHLVHQMLWGIVTRSNVNYAELLWEEFVHNIHRRPESPVYFIGDDFLLGNLKFVPKGKKDKVFGKPIPKVLITEAIKTSPYYQQYLEMVGHKPTAKRDEQKKTASEPDKRKNPTPVKKPAPAKQTKLVKEKSTKPTPLKKSDKGKRRTPTTENASTRPSAQPEDDTSVNIIHDTPSPTDAETVVDMKKTKNEDQDGSNPRPSHVALAGPNPEPMHEDFIVTVYRKVHKSLKHTIEEHVFLENPPSSSGTLSSMKNLDDAYTFGDQFITGKSPKDEPGKDTRDTEVESMFTIPIQQASSNVPPFSTLFIDLIPSKPVSFPVQEPVFTAKAATTTLPPPPPLQQQSLTDPKLANHVSALGKTAPQSEQPIDDIPIPDDVRISDSEDTNAAHLPKIKTKPDWLKPTADMGFFIKWYCKQIGKKKLSKADLEGPAFKVDLSNPKGNQVVPDNSKPLPLGGPPCHVNFELEELVSSLWIESEREYDISTTYDYTIVHKPRAVIYKDMNNQKKMMRVSEVHKFSDGTLTRILEKLDHMVKDFRLIWSKYDKRRSKGFIEVIERRLKIRRIFKNLKRLLLEG